jgi:MraZ protein
MFRGRHTHSIDAKGRVSIPTAFREELQPVAERAPVLTAHEGCLRLYPHDSWCQLEERILAQADVDPDAQDFVRLVLSSAEPTPIDRQGRILVPQHLREQAGLEREVTIAGVGREVELWDAARFRMVIGQTHANFREISRGVAAKLRSS